MNIFFRQIYQEAGAAFSIPWLVVRSFSDNLNALGKRIPELNKKLKSETFDLVFIVNAKLLNSDLKIYGPNFRKKANEVEFSIHIPYQKKEAHEEIVYALEKMAEGISMVFELYNVSPIGIKEAASSAIEKGGKGVGEKGSVPEVSPRKNAKKQ